MRRIEYLDACRAFAICSVVWGHSIQNLTIDSTYWLNDMLSQVLISFHMPLFMVISGYFFFSSLKKPFFSVIKKKAIQLLLPSVIWGIIVGFLAMLVHCDFSKARILYVLSSPLYSYWFLKSLFCCCFICLIGFKIFQCCRYFGLILFALTVMCFGEHLNYSSTISMLPFFCVGIALRFSRSLCFHRYFLSPTLFLLVLCVFVLCLWTWHSADYNIYLHPFSWTYDGIKSYMIRTVIGISGSCTVIYLIRYLYIISSSSSILSCFAGIGTKTLGIYLIQVVFAEGMFKMMAPYVDKIKAVIPSFLQAFVYDWAITPIASSAVILLSCIIIGVIRTNKVSRFLLLGEK